VWTQTDAEPAPVLKVEIPRPRLWEVGNDDSGDNDESPSILDGGYMFATDQPRYLDLPSPPVAFSKGGKR
jgi:hypothetical protein